MSDTGSEHLATYRYPRLGHVVEVEVIGCWDDETPEQTFEFYDLYMDGECINLGDPIYSDNFPTREEVQGVLETYELLT